MGIIVYSLILAVHEERTPPGGTDHMCTDHMFCPEEFP